MNEGVRLERLATGDYQVYVQQTAGYVIRNSYGQWEAHRYGVGCATAQFVGAFRSRKQAIAYLLDHQA